MLTRNTPMALISTIAALAITPLAFGATFSDGFDGPAGAPDPADWMTVTTNGPATVALDGAGSLVLNAAIASGSQRAFAITQASGFDPFAAPLRIELDGIALGGDPGAGHNGGFVMLGRSTGDATNYYFPNGSYMAYGVSVFLRKGAAGYSLYINEFSETGPGGTVLYATHDLSGTPTGLAMVVDGAAGTLGIEVTDATFTTGGSDSIQIALSDDFTAENMTVDGSLLSRVAVGGMNLGNTTVASSFAIDSINVIPEPATLGLMAMGLALAARRQR